MSRIAAIAALMALAACAVEVPDSNPNSGVGFDGYDAYAAERARRDAVLEAQRRAAPIPDERAIAQDTLGVLNATSAVGGTTIAAATPPATVTSTPIAATGTQPASDPGAPLSATAIIQNNPNISDEQNFDAVSSRETIESDRERLERQREAMQVAQPEALPERPGSTGPNVVAYALSTTNLVGEQIYERSGAFNETAYRRACARFGSSDQAQSAFLASGGPKRDRRKIDPDGDGFACFWDPTPFRAARQ